MKTTRFTPGDLLKPFSRKQVLTKAELLRACGCSAMTAWRILQQQGYLTSYNHNAKYYTLARTARFDQQGLWAYRDIRFSKWGTLPDTILGQIELSPTGMTAREIQELLHISNVKPTLTRLAHEGRLRAPGSQEPWCTSLPRPHGSNSNFSGGKRRSPPSARPGPCPIRSTSLPCSLR